MPDGLELPSDFLLELPALGSDMATVERAQRIEQLGQQRARAQSMLEQLFDNLAELYLTTVHGYANPDEIEQVASILAERERASAEQLVPAIERTQQELAAAGSESLDPKLREALQESVGVAVSWLTAYRNTREALLKVAAERRGARPKILGVRPAEAEIDHAALRREFMARFPRIRAALAM